MTKIRCAIYARKSPYHNVNIQISSLETQCEDCRNYLLLHKSEGYTEKGVYVDDKFSGKDTDRPSFQKLMEDINNNKIDIIVVHKLDRLSRSLSDFVKIMDFLKSKKVEFVSVSQHFDTNTSTGKLMMNILCSFAEFERSITIERQLDKIRIAKEKGYWLGGKTPLGYKTRNKKLIIDNKEAEIVRFIFHYVADGGSITQLVPLLINRYGQFRTHITKGWIYTVLKKQVYIGKVTHYDNIYEGKHRPIIGKTLFEKVASILNSRKPDIKERHDNDFLLRGLVQCKYCGSMMRCTYGKKKGKVYFYYHCPSNGTGVKRCYAKYISQIKLEQVLLPYIEEYLNQESLKLEVYEALDDADKNKVIPKFSLLWNNMPLKDKVIITHGIFEKIIVGAEGIEIRFMSGTIETVNWLPKIKVVL